MSPSLLVADGDAVLCNLYEEVLTEQGYRVITASDGLDCLDKLRQSLPDALVLDLELRWGGGDGVLAWLREERSAFLTPIITTAPADYPQEVLERILEFPFEHLPKPFELPALLAKIRSAVAISNSEESAKTMCDSCSRQATTDDRLGNWLNGEPDGDHWILAGCKDSYDEQAGGGGEMVPTQILEDLWLAARIKEALGGTGYRPLRDIDVAVTSGIVQLLGAVPSYYLKQVAQVTAKAVPGVYHIRNGLQVVAPSW